MKLDYRLKEKHYQIKSNYKPKKRVDRSKKNIKKKPSKKKSYVIKPKQNTK